MKGVGYGKFKRKQDGYRTYWKAPIFSIISNNYFHVNPGPL